MKNRFPDTITLRVPRPFIRRADARHTRHAARDKSSTLVTSYFRPTRSDALRVALAIGLTALEAQPAKPNPSPSPKAP